MVIIVLSGSIFAQANASTEDFSLASDDFAIYCREDGRRVASLGESIDQVIERYSPPHGESPSGRPNITTIYEYPSFRLFVNRRTRNITAIQIVDDSVETFRNISVGDARDHVNEKYPRGFFRHEASHILGNYSIPNDLFGGQNYFTIEFTEDESVKDVTFGYVIS